MSRSKRGRKGNEAKTPRIIEEREPSPFDSIVLKEKKTEEKKKTPEKLAPKKPGEIVQGYVPSASFADILSSFERTGNPYSLPKSSAKSSPSSFGDILDQWEGRGTKKKKAAPSTPTQKSQYKATKSFADILNQYEGKVRKEKKSAPEPPKETKKEKETFSGSTMFLKESEEESVPSNAVWSVIGGRNEHFVREEKEERREEGKKKAEKKYERVSPAYSPSQSFSSILASFDKEKTRKEKITEKKSSEKKEEISLPPEPDFFLKKDDETPIPSSVVWSVMGGANEGFVREEKEEPAPPSPEEKKSEVASKPYIPSKPFSEILAQYSESSRKNKGEREEENIIKEEEFETPEEPSFFLERDESVPLSSDVVWSVMGGANENFVRREKREEEKEADTPSIERVSGAYVPKKRFSSLLNEYEKEKVKTFDEIIREKGDGKEKHSVYTINELRRMDPQSTLDLHGETKKDSEAALREFFLSSWENGLRKISVITGKGLHSEDGQGVLRSVAESVIKDMPFIRETSNAPLQKGGSGAIWIILKEKE